jgi:DNA-binding MarR family transcriptional regulator
MPPKPGTGPTDVATSDSERQHIAGLLTYIERQADVSQRKLASELNVAVGLVNAYVKRCVKKGLIKIRKVPSRRYAYFLTPRGFAEKSRLTAEFLAWSLTFFRRARAECSEVMLDARRRKWRRIGLVGASDLAEIAILCASEQEITVVGLVDSAMPKRRVIGIPVVARIEDVSPMPDGWIVTVIDRAQAEYDALLVKVDANRVLAPAMLMVRTADESIGS